MLKKRPDYAVLVHRLYDNGKPKSGGLDILLEILLRKGKTILYVESPLLPAGYPYLTVSLRSKSGVAEIEKIKFSTNFSLLARLQELLILLYLPIKYDFRKICCITSDPLTTTPAILLKKLGFVKYVYYHCIDYSEKRFPNRIVNSIYRLLLNFSLSHADLVGCVSKRIQDIISDRGITNVYYVPNSVSMSEFKKYQVPLEKRIKNRLVVTCAGIANKYRIRETIDLFLKVQRKFSDATLMLIGSKLFEPEDFKEISAYIETLNIKDKIMLTGQLPKSENIFEISRSWVGLAFYDKSHSHVNFGDSLKIREYAALGIPVVSDKTTPTALEMTENGAGFAVDQPWDAYDVLVQLFSKRHLYEKMAEKGLEWAYSVDKDKIVDRLLRDFLDK